MAPELIAFLSCPACQQGSLAVRPSQGHLIGCVDCDAEFPIVNGVPRFLKHQDYADSFGLQWNKHRQVQLDSHTHLPLSRKRLFAATGWLERLEGETILEVGSGAGRFTEVLMTTGARVLSFDLSSAVDANYANNGHHSNLLIFQGDVRNIPVRERSMDKVLCLGVIQHTPDPTVAFRNLARCVRPGGDLVIDVYAAKLTALLCWKYFLRPVTTRLDKQYLYSLVSALTPRLIPLSIFLRSLFGKAGPRLVPILQYDHWGLSPEHNREWAILDTFDMYSPVHDHPQTLTNVRRWYDEAGFIDVNVAYGANGIIGRGRRPAQA